MKKETLLTYCINFNILYRIKIHWMNDYFLHN